MSPKKTDRSSRKAQQFHRSSKPGMREPPDLPIREWIGQFAGGYRSVEREDLSGDDLVSARMSKIWLDRCLFVGTDLRQADLRGAYVVRCDFTDARLEGADLTFARFTGCNFSGAKLTHALLDGAEFRDCVGLPADSR